MRTSQAGKDLIREVEGLSLKVYLDSGGVPTIGVGHALTKSERMSGKIYAHAETIAYRNGITKAQAHTIFDQDLRLTEVSVKIGVAVPMTQNQYDALVSFCFNVGGKAFLNSTLLKKINARSVTEIPVQWRRWKYDNGVVVQGLINRREKELAMWGLV